ncbi:MAG: hypothetical protein IJS91_06920 [Bacteroidales bacterium]|nr:hypothetical protein [Bacteroidales bacterium]
MKKYLTWFVALAVAVSCSEEPDSIHIEAVSVASYDGASVHLSGDAQTFTVTTSGKGGEPTTPTSDTWISCYCEGFQTFVVTVCANEDAAPRNSHVKIWSGTSFITLGVEQDYRRHFDFYATNNPIDAAAGEYRVPVSSNLLPEEVSLSCSADWLTALRFEEGWLYLTVTENTGAQRTTEVSISSVQVQTSVSITQLSSAGKSYLISLNSLNLGQWPVYEAKDPDTGNPVGLVCREYLYKTRPEGSNPIVDGSYTVIYPYFNGAPDFTKGFICENGGAVTWNIASNHETKGSDMIALVELGTASGVTTVFLSAGSTYPEAVDLSGSGYEGATIAICEPYTLKDHRSGAADSAGNTSEYFEYAIVKIGMQYWIKSNFASSRQKDGTPIPTGFNAEEWAARSTGQLQPMCLVSATGSANTYEDANVPEAQAIRAQYGCLYNYSAIVGQSITFTDTARADFVKEDRLSPEGWSIPSKDDFSQLLGYVIQKDIREMSNEDYTAELIEKMHVNKGNVTGFSAIGSRGRAATGAYGAVLYYLSMNYNYAFGSHTMTSLRLLSNTYEPIYDITIYYGAYVRLLKKVYTQSL